MHGRYDADGRIRADSTDGVSVGTTMVAIESTPGEKVVATHQGSPSAAAPPEITEGLSALLSWRTAGNSPDQVGCEAVVRSEEHTREKEEIRDTRLCVLEPGL